MEEQQKDMFELNLLNMQLKQLEQQAFMQEQQLTEYQTLIFNLDELKKTKKGHEMLLPFAKDIFVKGKLEDDKVYVVLGSKTVAKKSIDEAKKIVEKHREKVLDEIELIRKDMEKIFARILELERKAKA